MRVQVAIDCADPHRLAGFYAAGFDEYEIERHEPIIRGLKEQGLITDDDIIEVDGQLAFVTAAGCSDPTGALPRLLFQKVPEGKVAKNRVHLDFHTGGGSPAREAIVERLLELGATRLWDGHQGPSQWVTMADLEGNELCIAD